MLKSLIKNKTGNIALLSAFTLPVIVLGVIYAVDYGLYVQTRQDIASAARTAALSAANEAHIAYADQEDVDFEELIEQHAEDTFQALTGDIRRVEYANIVELKVTPKVDNNKFSVHVGYDAKYASIAPGITSKNVYHITNKSRATVSSLAYVNINLVFDVSASMGIGATEEDMEIVDDVTGCAFTCHIGATDETEDSTYDLARAAGASMRIDVARDAAISAIDAVEEVIELDDQVSFGLYKFDSLPQTILPYDSEDATDLDEVRTLLNSEVVMGTSGGGTQIERAIDFIANELPPNGSGRTPDDRIQYVVILTDGVEDGGFYNPNGSRSRNLTYLNNPSYRFRNNSNFVSWALDPSACQTLTDDNTGVFFIHTEYLIPTLGHIGAAAQGHLDFFDDTLNAVIPQRFNSCSGNLDNVYPASSPDEIETAFSRLLKELSSPLRVF